MAVVPGVYGGDVTVYSATQIPHILKVMIAATCGVPEHKLRVIAPAVGGAFGSKLNVYAEELIAVAARPPPGRAHPLDRGPQRERGGHDPGPGADPAHGAGRRRRRARSRPCGPSSPPTWAPTCSSSRPASRCSAPSSTTACTTCRRTTSSAPACSPTARPPTPTGAPGGPRPPTPSSGRWTPWPAAVGVDGAEIRRRNYIPPDKFPYDSIAGLTYDSGNYEPTLDRALELVGYDDLRAEQQRRRDAGRDQAPRHRRRHLRRDVRPRAEPGARLAELRAPAAGRPPRSACCRPARSRSSAARRRTARATRRAGRRSWPTGWASTPTTSRCCTPTPRISPIGMDTYGSRSLPVGGRGGGHGHRRGHRQGPHHRRPPARVRRGRPRARRRRAARAGHARRSR